MGFHKRVLVVEDEPSGARDEGGWRVEFVSTMMIDEKLILNWYHIRVESK